MHIPFEKWLHFKEAFSPQLVHEAIASSSTRVQRCIDPFGGSGTTAIACQLLGVQATTIEVNPYLADLIEAKLTCYDNDSLVRDLAAVLCEADQVDCSARLANLPETFVEPGVDDRWLYDGEVANRILAILQAIETLKLAAHQRFFRALLGGTLVGLSNAVVRGKGRRYRRGWEENRHRPGDVDTAFAQAVAAAIGELSRFGERASTAFEVVRGDSREAVHGLGTFDLAVFSPPYPNSFDYTDVYNIELWMLGYLTNTAQNRHLRARTLSSHVQIHRNFRKAPRGSQQLDDVIGSLRLKAEELWNRHIPTMVGSYFAELLEVVEAVIETITPRGTIWIVVGDSSYGGVSIHVGDILAELADARGLSTERLQTLRRMRKSAQQGGQEQLAEKLLVLRRI